MRRRRKRRADITRESDFYGAMDGASKFVRGDAIAGVIITFVNILGGMYVGIVEQDLGIWATLEKFTILTIGDGLVSQIPAFIVSTAAAMIVTRSAEKRSLGEELLGQLTAQPVALALTAGFLVVLAVTPLPKPPLLLLAASTGVMAYVLTQRQRVAGCARGRGEGQAATTGEGRAGNLAPDTMELNVGYGLIKVVDRKAGRGSARSDHQHAQAGRSGPGYRRPAHSNSRRHAAPTESVSRVPFEGSTSGRATSCPVICWRSMQAWSRSAFTVSTRKSRRSV